MKEKLENILVKIIVWVGFGVMIALSIFQLINYYMSWFNWDFII